MESFINKKVVKKAIKKAIHLDQIRTSKRLGEKLSIGFPYYLLKIKVVPFDYRSILEKSNPQNYSNTSFYYGLDDKIAVYSQNSIIGNIPVDYSYILARGIDGIKDKELKTIIEKYIDKAADDRIKKTPVNNLQDALQMILFWNQLLWQTGHRLCGLGRLDKVLDQYALPANARELVIDFLRTLHYCYEFKSNMIKGDTGQIILVGGLEKDGTYFRNGYTDLFIECVAELKSPDPKTLLRASYNIPRELVKKAIESISTGIGCPLVSNDDVVIPLLKDFGYEEQDAYNYGVSACWEPLSIGNSLEQNNLANVEYGKCVHEMILDNKFSHCKTFNEVYKIFEEKLRSNISEIKVSIDSIRWAEDKLLSALMGLNCDLSLGGAKYNNYGILSNGMSSAVNSLLNIQKFVFENKQYSLKDIQKIINYNYESDLDVFSKNDNGFGTDSKLAIELTNKIIRQTEEELAEYRNYLGGRVKFGLSSPGYLVCGKNVGATLDGRKAFLPFSTHISREKGEPITEIMNFEAKLKFSGISCNANVIDVMVQSSLIKDNIDKFASCLMGGIKEGIFQLQMNVLSYLQLVDAKAHPEKYPNLIVRVWGFSAYFNDLPDDYKDHLIQRAKEMEHVA